MNFVRYWGRVICVAFRHALTPTQDVLFLLIIGVGLAAGFVPAIKAQLAKAEIDMGAWQVAASVLGSIVAMRLLLAPYWIYQEQTATIAALNGRLKNKTTKGQMREKLAEFMERLRKCLARIHREGTVSFRDLAEIDRTVKQWLTENLDASYATRFTTAVTHPTPPEGIGNEVLRTTWIGVRCRMDNLGRILEEFT